MNRESRYPDTKFFHYFNANPKGKITTDCVIRALSLSLMLPYNGVVMDLANLQCKYALDNGDKKLIDRYLKSKGWVKQKQPRKSDNTKYTGKEFCQFLQEKYCQEIPTLIANIGSHHIVSIVNGKIYDTWNSTQDCVGNYWIFQENVI